MKTSYVLVLPLALSACSGDALDVGQDSLTTIGTGGSGGTGGSVDTAGSGGTGGSSTTGAPLPDWTDLGECPTTGLDAPQFVGVWEGALEDLSLQPVVPLRLVITKATSDGVCGAVSWGTTTPPRFPSRIPSNPAPRTASAAPPARRSPGSPTPSIEAPRETALCVSACLHSNTGKNFVRRKANPTTTRAPADTRARSRTRT